MIIPKPLLPGDTVALVALASALRGDDVPDTVRKSAEKLEALGFHVVIDPTCYHHHGFFAGTDRERADALNRAFADDGIDGIWCLRGGYGCIRLLELLDWDMIARHPKPFIGYSDITTLHTALHERCGLCTFHGLMAASDRFEGPSLDSLLHAIQGTPDEVLINPDGTPLRCLQSGIAEGELVGGNLSLIAASTGTPWDLDTTGKLLFLEDVGEFTYSIDRYLQQVYLSGKLNRCAGVIFGGFTNVKTEDPRFGFEMDEILDMLVQKLHVPVIAGLQAGHMREKVTLLLGRRYRMNANTGEIRLIS